MNIKCVISPLQVCDLKCERLDHWTQHITDKPHARVSVQAGSNLSIPNLWLGPYYIHWYSYTLYNIFISKCYIRKVSWRNVSENECDILCLFQQCIDQLLRKGKNKFKATYKQIPVPVASRVDGNYMFYLLEINKQWTLFLATCYKIIRIRLPEYHLVCSTCRCTQVWCLEGLWGFTECLLQHHRWISC